MRLSFSKLREHCCLPSEEQNKVGENSSVNQVFGNVVKLKHVLEIRDGADNKKCIRMLRCIRKPCPHAAPHRIQTQLSSRCTAPHRKLNIL